MRTAFSNICLFRTIIKQSFDAAGIPWKMEIEGNEKAVITATVGADLTVQVSRKMNKPSVLNASAGLQTIGEIAINLY